MVSRNGGARAGFERWGTLVSGCLLAAFIISCDGHRVVEPPASGVIWTRLTSTTLDDCLFPDVLVDSLVWSITGLVPVGGSNFALHNRLVVSGIDGANHVVMGFPGAAPWNAVRPRWVGRQRVIYQDNRSGTYDLWYRDLEDFFDHRLTNFSTNEAAPAPRPGMASMAYIELRNGATSAYDNGRLVLIPDTTAVPLQRIYLTPDTLLCNDPDWDPTGTKLCFSVQSTQDGSRHIYTINLAPGDSLPTQITVGNSHDFHPRWSPDGHRIAFTTDRTGRWGVWVVNPIGEAQGLQVISFDDTGATVFSPAWLPDQTGLIVSSNGRGGIRSLWLLTNLPAFSF